MIGQFMQLGVSFAFNWLASILKPKLLYYVGIRNALKCHYFGLVKIG